MAAKKGTMPPAAGSGRKKGSKNRLTKDIVARVIEINAKLDTKKMGLADIAEEDPKWFHTIFTRAIIPKNITVSGGDTPIRIAITERLEKALARIKPSG